MSKQKDAGDEPYDYDGALAVGIGIVRKVGEETGYSGTVPSFDKGQEEMDVVILRRGDWDLVARTGLAMLLGNHGEMTDEMKNAFPDRVTIGDGKEESHLYLQPYFYALNARNMAFVRYQSVDSAFDEEEL